jgi:hypothetical protein
MGSGWPSALSVDCAWVCSRAIDASRFLIVMSEGFLAVIPTRFLNHGVPSGSYWVDNLPESW